MDFLLKILKDIERQTKIIFENYQILYQQHEIISKKYKIALKLLDRIKKNHRPIYYENITNEEEREMLR